MDESTRGLHLSNILKDKLGPHLDWAIPKIEDVVGPYDLSPFKEHNERRLAIVEECKDILRTFTDEIILILAENRMDDPVSKEWRGLLRTEIGSLSRMEPPWYAGGFGHPDYKADFLYWSQAPYYSLHEAVLLSLGVEPSNFLADSLEKMAGQNAAQQKGLCEPVRYLLRRRDQMHRQFYRGFSNMKITPAELFNWFEVVQLKIHPEFESKYLQKLEARVEPEHVPPRADKREIDTICQLFAAMAIDYLGYDPKAKRSPTAKEITELAASLGLSITDDTVRKYLRKGASFIPDDWEPPTK